MTTYGKALKGQIGHYDGSQFTTYAGTRHPISPKDVQILQNIRARALQSVGPYVKDSEYHLVIDGRFYYDPITNMMIHDPNGEFFALIPFDTRMFITLEPEHCICGIHRSVCVYHR